MRSLRRRACGLSSPNKILSYSEANVQRRPMAESNIAKVTHLRAESALFPTVAAVPHMRLDATFVTFGGGRP
ncbi:hypothetical protein GCM10023325_06910 [Sphingomonas lutea]